MMQKSSINLRWKIIFLLSLASALNAIDRNTLGILANTIQAEFSWTDSDYANLTAMFIFSYTLMYALSGRIIDKIGTRKGLGIFLGGWSLVTILHSVARTVGQFSVARFFLGITESANFPAGVKASSEWFPIRERALAIGIFNAGTAIGAAVAVPIVSFCAILFGWRSTFIITGFLGFIWLFFWFKNYYIPQEHPKLSQEEKNLILEDEAKTDEATGAQTKTSFWKLMARKETWGCFCARIFIDPVTYFLLFWVPKYLQDVQGFSLAELGVMAWLPYAAMGIGTILGGMIPKWLIEKHSWSLDRARKTMMFSASTAIILLCTLLYYGASAPIAITALSLVMFSHGTWANITLPSEIYPKNVQATITGVGGTLGGITSVVSQKLIGATIATYSYLPIFIYIGGAYMFTFICVLLLIGKLGIIRKLES